MGHTVREQAKLLARVRRIRGQIEALERAVAGEAGCAEILHLIAAARGAMNGLMAEVLEDHVAEHVLGGPSEAARARAGAELVDVVRTYFR